MIEAETLIVYRANVLEAIEEATCDDVTKVLKTLFPETIENEFNNSVFNQIRINLYCKDHSTDWNAHIGIATKGELHDMIPNLYDNSDKESATIVITIPQGSRKRAKENVIEMLKQEFALQLNGVMDRDH